VALGPIPSTPGGILGGSRVSSFEQVGGSSGLRARGTVLRRGGPRKARAHWLHQDSRRLVGIDLVAVLAAVGLAHWLPFGGLPGTRSTHPNLDYRSRRPIGGRLTYPPSSQ
jgi:hypothetical protein